MASRSPSEQLTAPKSTPLAPWSRDTASLLSIQREIEASRREIAEAVADLEVAARRLTTADHWKTVGKNVFEQRPVLVLGVAFGLGCLAGAMMRPAIQDD